MYRLLGLLLLLASINGGLANEEVRVSGAKLKAYGIYKERVDEREENPNTVSGYVNQNSDQVLLKTTDVIKGEVGRSFGIEYVVVGQPAHASIELTIKLIHPPIKNPKTGEVGAVDENTAQSSVGELNYDGFSFDEAWEIAPGKWTFQIYRGSKMLLEKSFTVTAP